MPNLSGRQEAVLKELVEKFFDGGNAPTAGPGVLKGFLEAIRDFVKENFD